MNEYEVPNKDGSLRGDTRSMPDRGTMTGVTDTYGADLGRDSLNRKGSITGATKSDAAMDNGPHGSPTV